MKKFIESKCECCEKIFEVYRKARSKKYPDKKYPDTKPRKYCYECSPYGSTDKRHPRDRTIDFDGKRTCTLCRERKELNNDNYGICKTEKTGYGGVCKKCLSKRTTRVQKASKEKYVQYKGGECQVCGYNKCNGALCFHHINPEEKEFTLAKYKNRAWEIVKKELDKCLLVCANCHAEIHAGLIDCTSVIESGGTP